MKTQPLYRYLTMAALLSIWGCASTQQTAQNAGEVDDLYGTSGNAQVYASTANDASTVAPRQARQRTTARGRNANPDYNDEQIAYNNGSGNADEYYSELSTRNLNRGISPDPGWSDNTTNSYNSGFVNGYNAAQTSALSWNRWGFNNMGFYSGLGLGVGLGYGGLGGFGYSPFYSGFNSPYYYDSFAYSPFGYGGGFGYGGFGGYGYSPFYSPFGYSAFAYSPFGYGLGSYYGGGYYGNYGYPGYVNNVVVTGADPYRNNRTYYSGARTGGRYTSDFDNTNRGYNSGGRRAATGAYANSSGNATSGGNASNSGYYAPRGGRNSSYYYDNGSTSRSSGNSIPTYSGNANATSTYSAPRGGRNYSNSTDYSGNGGGRSSYQQPSYQAPQRTYQSQGRSYQQPSYQQPSYQQPSYQSQSRGFSQPSYSAPSGGGYSGGGSSGGGSTGGGGGRGPR